MSVYTQYIKQRIKNNKNFCGVITGATGSGKSMAALKIGELLDPNFTVSRVVFSAPDFMKIVNQRPGKGSVIVFDEAGCSMSAREWYSLQNKLLNYVLQTFRKDNLIILFTVPSLAMIDSTARSLFHAILETTSIDYKNKICNLKFLQIQNHPRTGKIYYKYLRRRQTPNSVPIPFKVWKISLPKAKLIRKYEHKKDMFTQDLNKNITIDLEEADMITRPKRVLSDRQRELFDHITDGLDVKEAANKMGITIQSAYDLRRRVIKAGYKV